MPLSSIPDVSDGSFVSREPLPGASTRDPARFSFAHGGKDGFPYPVAREVYDDSIEWLRSAVERARIGESDRLAALRRITPARGPATR